MGQGHLRVLAVGGHRRPQLVLGGIVGEAGSDAGLLAVGGVLNTAVDAANDGLERFRSGHGEMGNRDSQLVRRGVGNRLSAEWMEWIPSRVVPSMRREEDDRESSNAQLVQVHQHDFVDSLTALVTQRPHFVAVQVSSAPGAPTRPTTDYTMS